MVLNLISSGEKWISHTGKLSKEMEIRKSITSRYFFSARISLSTIALKFNQYQVYWLPFLVCRKKLEAISIDWNFFSHNSDLWSRILIRIIFELNICILIGWAINKNVIFGSDIHWMWTNKQNIRCFLDLYRYQKPVYGFCNDVLYSHYFLYLMWA